MGRCSLRLDGAAGTFTFTFTCTFTFGNSEIYVGDWGGARCGWLGLRERSRLRLRARSRLEVRKFMWGSREAIVAAGWGCGKVHVHVYVHVHVRAEIPQRKRYQLRSGAGGVGALWCRLRSWVGTASRGNRGAARLASAGLLARPSGCWWGLNGGLCGRCWSHLGDG